ncbi:MAG TPA: di-heme oxidoredictase family protein [Polyangia bacterium]|nr:di-heme oxidoredictase family protein [Polyangia bacterium]
MNTKTSRTLFVLASSLIAGTTIGAAGCSDLSEDVFSEQSAALGDRIPGTSTTDSNFASFKANFNAREAITDGLGPIFNAEGCGVCHDAGAAGGASATRIERRYGRFVNGVFDPLANRGGSLRQLFSVGAFTGRNGQACNPPVESEPAEATVHNVGRVTTPLFGLGLVDSMPDSFFTGMAAGEPTATRGVANIVSIVLPNDRDVNQNIGTQRVGRFGWKAGVPNLLQFAADAYLNEMGITTQSCFKGTSITAFSTESAPNGIPVPAGCDDLAPPAPAGAPAGTDDGVGSCAGGITLVQKDIDNFKRFMTNLAPPPRDLSNSGAIARGTPLYDSIGCANCHTRRVFTSPSPAPNGVPSGTNFQPFSDFLAHDMGTLGDMIGNAGDTVAVTRRMRTAPLWGVRFRPLLLHDGRCGDVPCAIQAHDGQGASARSAFNALTGAQQQDVVNFVRSM